MTVFDNNDPPGEPVAEHCLQRERHASRGFAAAGDEYFVDRREIIDSVVDLAVVIVDSNRLCDGCKRVRRIHTRHKDFLCVGAQSGQRHHAVNCSNRRRTSSNRDDGRDAPATRAHRGTDLESDHAIDADQCKETGGRMNRS
jgi:hypothetical protein